MSAAHSPGPWRVKVWPDDGGAPRDIDVETADGDWVADWCTADCDQATVERMLANIRLIAAAPAMLEALEAIEHQGNALYLALLWPGDGTVAHPQAAAALELRERAQAVIALARGETP